MNKIYIILFNLGRRDFGGGGECGGAVRSRRTPSFVCHPATTPRKSAARTGERSSRAAAWVRQRQAVSLPPPRAGAPPGLPPGSLQRRRAASIGEGALLDISTVLRLPWPMPSADPLFHNCKIKHFPDGSAEILIGSQPFGGGARNLPGFLQDEPLFVPVLPFDHDELEERRYSECERDAIVLEDDADNQKQCEAECRAARVRRSVSRAKKAVRDIARANPWKFFVTLTLSPERVDRYSVADVWRHMRHWLGNAVRRKGLAYILVLEHHKDGAIHAHGLFNDALEAVDSGTMSVPGRKAPVKVRSDAHRQALGAAGAHTVYNLPSWGWGFSTAIELYGEMDRAINYVCKYIGKSFGSAADAPDLVPQKIGGRWYYSGGHLQRPTVEWLDVDIRDFEDCDGWWQSDNVPWMSFLSLRISADGVVQEFSKPVENPPSSSDPVADSPSSETVVPQTRVSRETPPLDTSAPRAPAPSPAPSPRRGDAEHDSDRIQPPQAGDSIVAEPSAGHAPPHPQLDSPSRQLCLFGPRIPATLATSAPRAQSASKSHLTFLGLSNDTRQPRPPSLSPPPGPQ